MFARNLLCHFKHGNVDWRGEQVLTPNKRRAIPWLCSLESKVVTTLSTTFVASTLPILKADRHCSIKHDVG
jgi:hypothetical protein